jgi:hypothetical protein
MNVLQPASDQFHIPMMSIDSLCLNECDLIALDVEGFEQQALEGAKQTILKYKPVIIAERFNTPEQQMYMKNLGYDYVEQSFLDSIYTPSTEAKFFKYAV